MNGKYWLDVKDLDSSREMLRKGTSVDRTAERHGITKRHLQGAYKNAGFRTPSEYLRESVRSEKGQKKAQPQKKASPGHAGVSPKDLFAFTKKAPKSLEEICDHFDISPGKAKRLVAEAQAAGLHLLVGEYGVGFHVEERNDVRNVIPPVVGETQRVGVISDLHYGSKYILQDRIVDFIEYAYSKGVLEILIPGDILEGSYRHAKYEVTHTGLEEQARSFIEHLPRHPGLTYHMITGNHDFTFTNDSGVNVGAFLVRMGREAGRKDLFAYGDRGAFLKVRGALIHMWHPLKGMGYAISYPLQKQVEKYSSGEKPDILLAGHWHVHGYFRARGVRAIACPTFQGGGSAFGRALGGAPDIGGLILSWDLTQHGTLRNFTLEHRAYFEVEKIHRVRGAR